MTCRRNCHPINNTPQRHTQVSLSHHLACVRYAALPTMLWCCWLGVRKSVLPVKIELWGVGVVICVERGADCLCMVLLIPLHPKTPSSLASFKSRLVLPFCVGKEVLWRCWLGGRKGIQPVKIERWCAGVVICLEQGADLHVAQLMPLPLTVLCFSKVQIGFTFLVPAHLGSPGKRAVKRVCVCVCVCWKRGR